MGQGESGGAGRGAREGLRHLVPCMPAVCLTLLGIRRPRPQHRAHLGLAWTCTQPKERCEHHFLCQAHQASERMLRALLGKKLHVAASTQDTVAPLSNRATEPQPGRTLRQASRPTDIHAA